LVVHGSCRVCTVLVNGRPQPACNQPVAPGAIIENASEKVMNMRRSIIEMLFVEGNHFCPLCEKSGNCELQALAYRFGIAAPRFPFMFPKREVDATHPEIYVDRNRCILCGRCVRASRDIDGKTVFEFVGRGHHKQIAVNAAGDHLGDTKMKAADKAAQVCPVGSIIIKRVGYKVPVGQRLYDKTPIGADVEKKQPAAGAGK
jgi:[NiFe] hydrogenase diaphorase moiety small subunit